MIEKIEPPDMAQDQVVRRVISLAVSAALRIESGRPAA
jgi:hypothetical protein